MDHLGLLTLVRKLSSEMHNVVEERKNRTPIWKWNHMAVVMPESKCAFCRAVVRSNGIWLFSNAPRYNRLVGMIKIEKNGDSKLVYPSHPHDMGGGSLCLGSNSTGMDLLASPANLNDCPIGYEKVPDWLEKYWNHKCPSAAAEIKRRKERAIEREREYQALRTIRTSSTSTTG